MTAREMFRDIASRMQDGQCVQFSGRDFRQAFGRQLTEFSPFAPERAGPESDFLSGCMGSAYGAVRCCYLPEKDAYLVSKHPPEERRDGLLYHVDFDREHLYEKASDGMWKRNETPYIRTA